MSFSFYVLMTVHHHHHMCISSAPITNMHIGARKVYCEHFVTHSDDGSEQLSLIRHELNEADCMQWPQ